MKSNPDYHKKRAYGSFLFDGNGYKITGLTINKPVTDPVMIGRLFGYTNGATISNVSLEDINVTSLGFVGGLVGSGDAIPININSSYWDINTTGQTSSHGGGIGLTTDEMKDKDTYSGLAFDTVWDIQEGVSYPTLINNPEGH